MRHRRPAPIRSRRPSPPLHARAATAEPTPTGRSIDRLYAALEQLEPSPVITLEPRGGGVEDAGPRAALDMIEPLAERLAGYFHFFGREGALLLQLGRQGEARSGLRPGHRPGQHRRPRRPISA